MSAPNLLSRANITPRKQSKPQPTRWENMCVSNLGGVCPRASPLHPLNASNFYLGSKGVSSSASFGTFRIRKEVPIIRQHKRLSALCWHNGVCLPAERQHASSASSRAPHLPPEILPHQDLTERAREHVGIEEDITKLELGRKNKWRVFTVEKSLLPEIVASILPFGCKYRYRCSSCLKQNITCYVFYMQGFPVKDRGLHASGRVWTRWRGFGKSLSGILRDVDSQS